MLTHEDQGGSKNSDSGRHAIQRPWVLTTQRSGARTFHKNAFSMAMLAHKG